MHITYRNPGYEHSIESIMLFQTDEQTAFWFDPILHFYPQIDKNELTKRDVVEKRKYLDEVFREIYTGKKAELDSKTICYNEHFTNHKCQIEDALSDAFELDARLFYIEIQNNWR